MHGKMKFILASGKEFLRLGGYGIIVNAAGKNIQNFTIELLFGCANTAHPFDQFVKVVLLSSFQTFVIDDEPFHQIFSQRFRRPNAKLCTAMRLDPVTDGNDDVQIVILNISCNRTLAFLLNCCKICNSCLSIQFAFLEYVVDMRGGRLPVRGLRRVTDMLIGAAAMANVRSILRFHKRKRKRELAQEAAQWQQISQTKDFKAVQEAWASLLSWVTLTPMPVLATCSSC